MADAHEAAWDGVHEEAAEELDLTTADAWRRLAEQIRNLGGEAE